MKPLTDCFLYGMIDLGYIDTAAAAPFAERMLRGGVDILQLRGKHIPLPELTEVAAELHGLTNAVEVPLIVNDHPEIAREVAVEGVHVGQDDLRVAAVRTVVGRPIVVGKSTHGLSQARAAQEEGADYIGFGPLFATPTKPDYKPIGLTGIRAVHQDVTRPIFCIGGITRENLAEVIAAGARRVVIVSGLLKAQDVVAYAREAKALLSQSKIENRKSEI
jgi:thiamine-phosphate pyrophosphorylase